MAPRPILILKTGETLPPIKEKRGDFEGWFMELLSGTDCEFRIARPYEGEALPVAHGLGGVLVTGSPKSVYDDEGWIGEAAGWVMGAATAGVPVLGVCFGHQLVADAFGGVVSKNPAGRETGTVEVQVNEKGAEDPLFEGLPRTLVVQASHQDAVVKTPETAEILAGNENTAVQAFRIGTRVRAVQFHPEFDAEIVRDYVDGRADRIAAEAEARGEDGDAFVERTREAVRESDHGPRLLRNWLQHFVA